MEIGNKFLIQDEIFFCDSVEKLKDVSGDAVLFFKLDQLDQKAEGNLEDYFEKTVDIYSLGEVGPNFNIFQTLNGCIKNAFMPMFTNVMSMNNVVEDKRFPI